MKGAFILREEEDRGVVELQRRNGCKGSSEVYALIEGKFYHRKGPGRSGDRDV